MARRVVLLDDKRKAVVFEKGYYIERQHGLDWVVSTADPEGFISPSVALRLGLLMLCESKTKGDDGGG